MFGEWIIERTIMTARHLLFRHQMLYLDFTGRIPSSIQVNDADAHRQNKVIRQGCEQRGAYRREPVEQTI